MNLILGAAQFGMAYGVSNQSGLICEDEIKKILLYTEAVGIKYIDTAPIYGNSESILGTYAPKNIKIITKLLKLPAKQSFNENWLFRSIKKSQSTLHPRCINTLLIHHSDDLLKANDDNFIQSLQKVKNLGLVEKIGVSIYDPYELINYRHLHLLDVVQSPMNVFDSRIIESGLFEKLLKMSIELHLRSCFLQGLLLMDPQTIPHKLHKYQDMLSTWRRWCQTMNLTPLEASLHFVKQHAPNSKIIVGCQSHFQLKEIVSAYNAPSPIIHNFFGTQEQQLINPSNWS